MVTDFVRHDHTLNLFAMEKCVNFNAIIEGTPNKESLLQIHDSLKMTH